MVKAGLGIVYCSTSGITIKSGNGRPATSRGVHYTTSCNTQSSAPEDA